MKVLFLSHRIPYPPNKGDKIRSFNELKYLSKNHEVDLVCLADESNDLKHKAELKRYCRCVHVAPLIKSRSKIKGLLHLLRGSSISVGYFHDHNLQQVVNQLILGNHYDAIFCFSSPMAEYIFRSPLFVAKSSVPSTKQRTPSAIRSALRPTLIMDFCDLDSDKWCQYAARSPLPLKLIYGLEARQLLKYEKRVNRAFDHSIFVSQKEANLFWKSYPQAQYLSIIPNGVDHDYFSPEGQGGERLKAEVRRPMTEDRRQKTESCNLLHSLLHAPRPTLLFTGAMDYHANVDGVSWFCKSIFPLVRQQHPKAQFYIVGSNPHPAVSALGKLDGVHVTGFVEDIRPYYRMADICVIPLRIARGIQNKVLEAMAMGKAVVTTPASIQGITAKDGEHLLVADTPSSFISKVAELMSDAGKREHLGHSAREFVKARYDWNKNMAALERLVTAE